MAAVASAMLYRPILPKSYRCLTSTHALQSWDQASRANSADSSWDSVGPLGGPQGSWEWFGSRGSLGSSSGLSNLRPVDDTVVAEVQYYSHKLAMPADLPCTWGFEPCSDASN